MEKITATRGVAPPRSPHAPTPSRTRGSGAQLVGTRAGERLPVPDRTERRMPPIDYACQAGGALQDELSEATTIVFWLAAGLAAVLTVATKVWG